MPCNDRPNHRAPWPAGTTPARRLTIAHTGCHNNSSQPCYSRQHTGQFTVCRNCIRHTRFMLGIQLPPAPVNPGAPWKHPLLVQTPLTGPGAGVLIQSGLSPPQPPAGFHPAIFANPIWWQTAPELLSGVLGAGRPELPFDGFLTRLCIKCETLVQCEEYYRRVTNYRGNETQSDLQRWETSYASSCTCRKKLGVGPFAGEDILCKPHRERQWKELVAARDERDRFLRGVENRAPPARKKLISASAATLQNRVNAPGWWRACRVSAIAVVVRVIC